MGPKISLGDNPMRAVSEVEQEERRRRRKPWMKIEVRGGGGFLVLGGALIAAGLGAAFAVHRAHVNNKRRRSSIGPTDETCEVESLNKGISFDGQLDEVDGEAARGFVSLMTLDPNPLTPSMKLADSCQGESSVHNTAEVQESSSMSKIDQSPTFKNLEIVVATEERILDTDTAACGDNVVQEFSLGGPVQKRNEKASKESEPVNRDELREGTQEFSFSGLEFTKTQDKNKQILEESELAHDNDKEEKDDREEEEEEALSPEELEEFSFRAVESDIIRNQTKQNLEESKLSHDKEDNEEGKEEESSDDIEAPSSDQSQEEETESSSVEEEAEREKEGSDGTGASSSMESSFEAVWPAEAIEQEKDASLLENHQLVTEESSKEKATAAQAEQEIEEYEKFVEEELAVEELLRNEIGTGPKTMKMESETGLMAMSYSNRLLLLLLILALAIGLFSFVQRDHLHLFHLARLCHHLYHVFLDPL